MTTAKKASKPRPYGLKKYRTFFLFAMMALMLAFPSA